MTVILEAIYYADHGVLPPLVKPTTVAEKAFSEASLRLREQSMTLSAGERGWEAMGLVPICRLLGGDCPGMHVFGSFRH